MDLRQLRYFLAIVEEGSFSSAAKRLNIAQPALSLHVRRMEEQLGTPLLLRGPQGVRETEAGALLARRARGLLAEWERSAEEVRSLGQEPVGTVRLGLPGTISGLLSLPLILQCRARHPKIKIIVTEAMSGFLREWLLDGRVELALLYADLRDAGVQSRALVTEELVLLVPPGADVAQAPARLIADLGLILPSGAHGLRMMLDSWLPRQGIKVDPVIEIDSFGSIKQLVENGYGCSILPEHVLRDALATGRLQVARFAPPGLSRGVWMAQSTARPMTRAAGAVSDVLVAVVEQLVQTGDWPGAALVRDPRPQTKTPASFDTGAGYPIADKT